MPLFKLFQSESSAVIRTKKLPLHSQAEINACQVVLSSFSPGSGQTHLNDRRIDQPHPIKITVGVFRPAVPVGVKEFNPCPIHRIWLSCGKLPRRYRSSASACPRRLCTGRGFLHSAISTKPKISLPERVRTRTSREQTNRNPAAVRRRISSGY